MAALIAYIGDRIGSKIGKRRMSLLGLRPKITAVIMTMITGMVITLMTLLVTSFFAPNVRLALFEDIHQIKIRNKQLDNQHSALLEKKGELEEKVLDLMDYMDILDKEKKRLVKDQQDTAGEIERLKQEKTLLNNELSKRLMEGEKLREQIKNKNEEARILEENLRGLEKENEEILARQEEILKQREEYKSTMDLLQKEKEKLIHQLNETLEEKLALKQTKEKLEESIQEELKHKIERTRMLEELQENLKNARSVKEELEKNLQKNLHDIKEREDLLNNLREELRNLDQEMKELKQESEKKTLTIASLKEVLLAKQQKRLVLNSMEPLIEKPVQIDGPISRDTFQRIFDEIIERIRKSMEKVDVDPSFIREEKLSSIESGVFQEASRIWREIEDAHLYVDKPSKGVLVFPISVNNIMSGEKLEEVNFIVLENRLLILKGKEIARAILDANLSAESVMAQLFEIDDQLKKQMFAQGVMGNRFRPRSPRQIMQFALIVNAVMSENSKTYLSIVADDDIYSSGNFAFRYDLQQVRKPASSEDAINIQTSPDDLELAPASRLLQRLREFHERYNSGTNTEQNN